MMIKVSKWMEPCSSAALALNKATNHLLPKESIMFNSVCDKPIV